MEQTVGLMWLRMQQGLWLELRASPEGKITAIGAGAGVKESAIVMGKK
ncbi:MAG: hypothetical protein ACO1N8_04970 [Methylophilus sp.]